MAIIEEINIISQKQSFGTFAFVFNRGAVTNSLAHPHVSNCFQILIHVLKTFCDCSNQTEASVEATPTTVKNHLLDEWMRIHSFKQVITLAYTTITPEVEYYLQNHVYSLSLCRRMHAWREAELVAALVQRRASCPPVVLTLTFSPLANVVTPESGAAVYLLLQTRCVLVNRVAHLSDTRRGGGDLLSAGLEHWHSWLTKQSDRVELQLSTLLPLLGPPSSSWISGRRKRGATPQ